MPNLTQITAGSFCRELVTGLEPLPQLLESWSLTPERYDELRKSEWFQRELKAAVEDVRDMGPDSTFIMRCKVLSEEFLGDVMAMMKAPTTPPDVKARLFDSIADLARLKPQKNSNPQSTGSGPQVIFQFGEGLQGVPKTITVEGTQAVPNLLSAQGEANHG